MIISHKHRFIFLHVPKCAGTSVRTKLLELDPDAETAWNWQWSQGHGRYVDRAHQPLADLFLSGRMRDLLSTYFVFAFVRNPYHRFLSAMREHLKDSLPGSLATPAEVLRELSPTNIRYNVSYIHFCPQHYFTHIGNKRLVDLVLDSGNVDAGMASVADAIEISPAKLLPVQRLNENASAPEGVELQLDDRVIELVNDLYAPDFSLYGYGMRHALADSQREISKAGIDLAGALPYRGNPERFEAVRVLACEVNDLRQRIREMEDRRQSRMTRLLRHVGLD
jgi:hypothetical protein